MFLPVRPLQRKLPALPVRPSSALHSARLPEDKLDDFTAAQLKFSVTVAPSTETEKDEEPWRAMQRLCARPLGDR